MARNEHIELYEKYVRDDPETIQWWEDYMPAGTFKPTYGYRRIYPLLEMIKYPREIEGIKDEFIVVFHGNYEMICRGSYDDFCIYLNDLRNNFNED